MNSQLNLFRRQSGSRAPAAPSHWKSFEKLIELSNRYVVVRKMGAEAKFIGGGKSIVTKGPVDFWGVCRGGTDFYVRGQAIVFDAKSSREERRLSLADDHFRLHQRQELRILGEEGAIAGLLVEATHETQRMVRWLPWNRIDEAPSIAWDDPRWIEVCGMDEPIAWQRILEMYRPAACV